MRLKRLFDIAVSATGLAVLSPFFIGAAAVGAAHFKGNPFYFVDRVGKDGELFKMVKLRSMTNETDPDGVLLPDDQRRTGYGRFLRISSLDELPQLWNVLKGDMSLVGPRPRDLSEPVPESHKDIFSVRPGLTGPWQVAAIGRKTSMSEQERLDLDVSYVRNKPSLWGDLKLMARTLPSFYSGHDGEYFGKTDPKAKL